MECKSCGAQISNIDTKCPYCQGAVPQPAQAQVQPAQTPPQFAPINQPIYQKQKPKGQTWVLIVLVLFFWPAAIWYAVTRDMGK